MKTLKNLQIVIVAIMLLFASCKSTSADNNLAANIPDNAIFVMDVKAKQIVDKGELNKFKEFYLYNISRGEIESENSKLATMFDEFLTDTRSSGLNLDKFYMYGIQRNENNFNFVVLCKMDNIKTFEAKFREMMSIDGGNEEPKDKGSYKQLNLGYDGNILWNNDLLYFINGTYNWDDDNDTDYSYLFKGENKNILSNSEFASFDKKNHDFGFWMSYNELLKIGDDDVVNMLNSMLVLDASNMYVEGTLNFEKGEAMAKLAVSPKSKIDEWLKQYPIIRKDFDNDLLKYFPENAFTVLKVSLNVQEYIRLINEQINKTSSIYSNNYYNPMDEFSEILNNDIFKTISSGLVGDVVMSIYGFQDGMIPTPLGSIIFNVKNKEPFDVIIKSLPSDILKKQDNHYAIMAGPLAIGYLAFNNNKIFATTDSKALDAFLSNGFDKHLGNSEYAANLKNDIFYWNTNIDLASYPDHIKMLLRELMGRNEYNTFESFINIYKAIEYRGTKDSEVIFSIKMQNTSNNSLKVILKNIDENVSKLIGNY